MSMQATLEAKLTKAFQPERLSVINESHRHAGHRRTDGDHEAVFDGSGETHFRIRIVSSVFSSMSRIDRHRAVNSLLADELDAGIHALVIEPGAPGEKTSW